MSGTYLRIFLCQYLSRSARPCSSCSSHSFLSQLGILDVFDPRVADLSPMTADLGVYARDVQQSIGVNIRNYMKPDRTHSRESSNVESPSIVPPRRDYYRYRSPGSFTLLCFYCTIALLFSITRNGNRFHSCDCIYRFLICTSST